MNWAVFVALAVAYIGVCVMGGIRRQTASWHWAAVGMCVVLAGWAFEGMGSTISAVIWLVFAGWWSWALHRRVRSLRQADEVQRVDR